ncbi:helix-turn-helix transcriptional regulator [Olsenella urininfantis]|uniref:helix-turn-helix transcriptional regulator n=1 Tax=Olsenella urininfantis TaxID=1871033 RepID=UPI001F289EFC|nr:helix-turn-helix transcriptional regulator [Olsenella urininfantis]
MPAYDERFAYLRPTSDFMSEALHKWAVQYHLLKEEDIDLNWYEEWKDEFNAEYSERDFPLRYRVTPEEVEPIEPWMNIQFAAALQRLRKKHDLTQDDLALAANTTKSTIRSYEQKKRLPKDSQLADLADALGVTKGALTFFDFGSPVQAVHVLFQIANTYGMIPDEIDGQVMLRTACRGMERYIDQWELAQNGTFEGVAWDVEVTDYQDWKDKYDFNYSGQSSRQSRYSIHWDKRPNGDLIDSGALESKYDPFDEHHRAQGGFLRA